MAKQIGSSDDAMTESPFVHAMHAASLYCVVRNSQMVVFSRTWCVCEAMYAKQYGLLPAKVRVTGPDAFAGLQTSVLGAQATQLHARDRILRVLFTQFNREEIDVLVKQISNGTCTESKERGATTSPGFSLVNLPVVPCCLPSETLPVTCLLAQPVNR